MPYAKDKEINQRVAADINKRSLPGIIIYPSFWVFIGIVSGFYKEHPEVFYWVTAIFLSLSLLRAYQYTRLKRLKGDQILAWHWQLFAVIISQGSLWGFMLAYALFAGNFEHLLLMVFSTAGTAAGGTNSFAPSKRLSQTFTITFCVPPGIAAFVAGNAPIGVMLFVYTLYLVALSNKINREYWRSLNNELALEKLSRTDALTKLDNRRYFDEKLIEVCRLSSRTKEKLAVLVIDCDNFKSINDTFGHDFGDQCLQFVADRLRSCISRQSDTVARYGGEEFSVLLPGTDAAGAMIIAEKMRETVAAQPFDNNKHQVMITISIGVTATHVKHPQPELPRVLFKQADQALYTAKASGRNQCVLYQDI